MLGKRIATGSVLVLLVVGTVLYGKGLPFAVLAGAAALLCALEYFGMFLPAPRDRRPAAALTVLAYVSGALLPFPSAVSAVLFCIAAAAFRFLDAEGAPADLLGRAAISALGVAYLGGFLSAWPRVRSLPGGEHWVLLGILTVAANDTFAYFVGRARGKRPLSRISPNKTVEGAVGGLVGGLACATAYGAAFLPGVPAWYLLGTAAVLGVLGQAGDLFESLLKRAAGVKDSGSLLPGHGGLLDRADGIIAVGPALHLLAVLSRHAAGA